MVTTRRAAGVMSPAQTVAMLRQAADILDGTECRLDRARALVRLGRALLDGGDSRAARPVLITGLELAVSCETRRLADSARQALHAARSFRPLSEAAARRTAAASTSRWVTQRIRRSPTAATSTPRSAAARITSAAGTGVSNTTMLVGSGTSTTSTPGALRSAAASTAALAWSSARRSTLWCSA